MSCTVRTAVAADIPAMHRIRCAVAENPLPPHIVITEASYRPFVRAGSAWVVEEHGRLRGFAAVDGPASNVWALFLEPEAEGQGIGRALLDGALQWARGAGLERLWLTTAKGTRAERFYARAGWERRGLTAGGEVRFERNIV